MSGALRFVDAYAWEHFAAMSLIHALGWRSTYREAVPADYMAQVITDDHWVPLFQKNHETGECHGLLLYREGTPVACCNYGPARAGVSDAGGTYQGWGEVISFYTHPAETGKGYGSLLMAETLSRLEAQSFFKCYVLVLRENEGARRFYARHGFSWDGSQVEIPFPGAPPCIDLRYTRNTYVSASRPLMLYSS